MTAFVKRHQLATLLFVLAVVMAVPLARIQSVAGEAHDAATDAQTTADDLADLVVAEDAEEAIEDQEGCELRNAFQRETRESDARLIDALESAFLRGASTAEGQAAVREAADQLRRDTFAGRNPEDEDRDCNDDGRLDDEDYGGA